MPAIFRRQQLSSRRSGFLRNASGWSPASTGRRRSRTSAESYVENFRRDFNSEVVPAVLAGALDHVFTVADIVLYRATRLCGADRRREKRRTCMSSNACFRISPCGGAVARRRAHFIRLSCIVIVESTGATERELERPPDATHCSEGYYLRKLLTRPSHLISVTSISRPGNVLSSCQACLHQQTSISTMRPPALPTWSCRRLACLALTQSGSNESSTWGYIVSDELLATVRRATDRSSA